MFGSLLGCYTIYTLSRALAPWWNFATCKIHFASKSCVLLYWQRCCTALQQRASARLCGVVQGMELQNFRSGRHLYSAGRPSRWALAHILVKFVRHWRGSQWSCCSTSVHQSINQSIYYGGWREWCFFHHNSSKHVIAELTLILS